MNSSRIGLLTVGILLLAFAPGANAASSVNGLSSLNGLASANGFSVNGLSANGLSSINGLSGNGLSSLNGVVLSNGLPSTSGAAGSGNLTQQFADWLQSPYGVAGTVGGSTAPVTLYAVRPNSLTDTAEGRELLKYLARCALPETVALVATEGGTNYFFPGLLGLTPQWLKGGLDESGERWISACLLAHTNAFGVHVPISVRGPHPRISTLTEADRPYSIQEGAYYGNLFRPEQRRYACEGPRRKRDLLSEYLKLRACAEPLDNDPRETHCGFVWAGHCSPEHAGPEGWACQDFSESGKFFRNCVSEPVPGGHRRHDADAYQEVITVYVMK